MEEASDKEILRLILQNTLYTYNTKEKVKILYKKLVTDSIQLDEDAEEAKDYVT